MLLAQAPAGIPVLTRGDDVAAVIAPALASLEWPDGSRGLAAGDVVVVSSKIVSKAEGRMIAARDREEAITSQTVREVARRERVDGTVLRIVENPLGLVMAAAGVDASNTPPGTVLLLPEDPDASARRIRRGLHARFGVRPGVLVTDTSGRPWRRGVADIAIGAAGVRVLEALRSGADSYGRTLPSTVMASADEVAAAAELVKGKAAGLPVAVVRGVTRLVTEDDGPGARSLVRPPEEDLFRHGSG
jgi:coenzyme F420-0:L-glutamate ligase/coenzyme F420-1:gamma-L-glutamate ligase